MKRIYDVIKKEYIEAKTIKDLAQKISADPSSVSRLLSGFNDCICNRYLSSHENGFILIDIDSKEEFHCADKKSFFTLLNVSYEENASKYIYEVLSGRQKTFSFLGRIFHLKGTSPTKATHHKSKNSDWFKDRKNEQILYKKLSSKLRCNLVSSIRSQGLKKRNKFVELAGCSPDFLLGWLESQFEDGMNWDNWGREFHSGQKSWHVDHIIPCNTFDLSNLDDQKKCFHYTNLRPLWEFDNLSRPKDGSDINPTI